MSAPRIRPRMVSSLGFMSRILYLESAGRLAPHCRLEAERTVEPPHQREQRLVFARQKRGQRRTGHLRIGKRAAAGERLKSQPLRGGMILGVATRHPLQRALVVESTKPTPDRPRRAIEAFWVVGDGLAQLLQLRPRRHS